MKRKTYSEKFKQFLIYEVQDTENISGLVTQYNRALGQWVRKFSVEKITITLARQRIVKIEQKNNYLKKMAEKNNVYITMLTIFFKSKAKILRIFK